MVYVFCCCCRRWNLFHQVHRGQRQVVVYVGDVLVRRLLHNTALLRLHLFGPHVDRYVDNLTQK